MFRSVNVSFCKSRFQMFPNICGNVHLRSMIHMHTAEWINHKYVLLFIVISLTKFNGYVRFESIDLILILIIITLIHITKRRKRNRLPLYSGKQSIAGNNQNGRFERADYWKTHWQLDLNENRKENETRSQRPICSCRLFLLIHEDHRHRPTTSKFHLPHPHPFPPPFPCSPLTNNSFLTQ